MDAHPERQKIDDRNLMLKGARHPDLVGLVDHRLVREVPGVSSAPDGSPWTISGTRN